ncbi:MAG: TMEM43 family protein [Desulfovibrionaceae bacterium]|nr:TMEM43 family protein [Desulfovibrionaceae bacterium]
MMEEYREYTETKSVSWFERLGKSFGGMVVGIVLLIAGTVLLWWNEGNFVGTGDALREAQAVTVELGDIHKLDSAKNGMLVHAVGPAATKDTLNDPVFGVSISAIRLERAVEFYQWTEQSKSEKRQKLGGGEETVTTYTYAAKWTNRPVDSSAFKSPQARTQNRNTVLMPLDNLKVQAGNVTFGAYRLPEFLINAIGGAAPLNVVLSKEAEDRLNTQLTRAAQGSGAAGMVHVGGNTVLLSASPHAPQVGDVRVAFKETRPGAVSILAKLNGDTFERYRARNGQTVSELSMGTHSLENMYGDAHSSNVVVTWLLRGGGTLAVIFGLAMIAAPLAVLAGVIPLLGSIVGAGAGIVSTLLGLAWSLVVISIAWLRFRPLIGICMLAVSGILIVLLYRKGRARKAAHAQATAKTASA